MAFKYWGLLLLLVAVGCAPATVVVQGTPVVRAPAAAASKPAAIATLEVAQAAATAVEQQVQAATQIAQATEWAYNLSVSQTAQAIQFQQTASAATATEQARQLQAQLMADAATATADALVRQRAVQAAQQQLAMQRAVQQYQLAATQSAAEVRREEVTRNVLAWLAPFLFMLLIFAALMMAWFAFRYAGRVRAAEAEMDSAASLRLLRGAPVPVWLLSAPATSPGLTLTDRWNQAVIAFCFYGDRLGFDECEMIGQGIATRGAWSTLSALLAEAGALRPTDGGLNWAAGWNYAELLRAIQDGWLKLPHPNDEPPLIPYRGYVRIVHPQAARTDRWAA